MENLKFGCFNKFSGHLSHFPKELLVFFQKRLLGTVEFELLNCLKPLQKSV